jgi:hypothetical protein
MQEVFVVFSAAALIFLVCRAIISCCSHDRNDEDDDRGYRRVFLESASGHFVPESYARNGAESGVGQNGAEDLRSQARSLRREWEETLKLADRARKKGDYAAAARYKRDVQGHPSAVEYLNKLAAEVNFTEKNKVRIVTFVTHTSKMRVGHAKTNFVFVMLGSYRWNGRSPRFARRGSS